MSNFQFSRYKILFILILFLSAFGERIIFDLGPNVELVTMALVLSSFYVGRKERFWLIFVVMLLSDLVIGNTNIFIFTWTGFLLPAIFLRYLSTTKSSSLSKIPIGTLAGILSNGFFFIWTNLGVWLLTNMYPKSAEGLLMSYINALPFLRYQLTSTLIFIPLGFVLTETTIDLIKNYQARIRVSLVK